MLVWVNTYSGRAIHNHLLINNISNWFPADSWFAQIYSVIYRYANYVNLICLITEVQYRYSLLWLNFILQNYLQMRCQHLITFSRNWWNLSQYDTKTKTWQGQETTPRTLSAPWKCPQLQILYWTGSIRVCSMVSPLRLYSVSLTFYLLC